MAERPRVSIDLTDEVRKQVRVAAALHDQSIMEYCAEAIRERLARDKMGTSEPVAPGVVAAGRRFRERLAAAGRGRR